MPLLKLGDNSGREYLNFGEVGSECCFVRPMGDVGICVFKLGDVGDWYLQGRDGCLMIGLVGDWYLNFGEGGREPFSLGDVGCGDCGREWKVGDVRATEGGDALVGGEVSLLRSGFGIKMTLAKLSSESTLVSLCRELSFEESLPSSFECLRSPPDTTICPPLPLVVFSSRVLPLRRSLGGGVAGGTFVW